eukprot:GFUD01095704.1.p1 GENE.GFUD01095704.1~~GFUD01095704.1.p1  ORF type:complete len:324 (-),score=58.07 GFUD01095704.1:50-994(-)
MLFSLIFTFLILVFDVQAKSKERSLTAQLLEEYCVSGRPVLNDSTAVDVSLGVTLQSIENVDESAGSLTGYYWLNLEWRDEYLTWQGWDILDGQTSDIRLRTEDIWLPDIEIYNMIHREDLRTRDMVVVSSDGSVVWIPSYKITSSCEMDTTFYPFDEQSCLLKFGSWVYNGWKLTLKLSDMSMDISTYLTNTAWDLISAEGKLNTVQYECCPEPYLDITYTIKLRRRTTPTGIKQEHTGSKDSKDEHTTEKEQTDDTQLCDTIDEGEKRAEFEAQLKRDYEEKYLKEVSELEEKYQIEISSLQEKVSKLQAKC